MSDPREAAGPAFVQQPAANDGVTAGTLLRRAREAEGLHVAALAVALKVPVRKLEALEDDRWDALPDAVFVRALASSVCRSLKIDPQPILERLPRTSAPRLYHVDEGINTPFRAPSDGAPPSWIDHVTKPVYLAVFALLLGALVLVLLPTVQTEDKPGAVATTAPAAPAALPAPADGAAVHALPAEPPAVAMVPAPANPGATAPAMALSPAATASMTQVSSAMPVPAAAAPEASPAATAAAVGPAAAASGIVVFRVKGPSWVEVTDAKGGVALRKVLETGESAGVSGVLPLQVTIGRVDQTEVQVRGKPYDLKPVSKDNVARFEVK
jgi:cytoskeleton protein RodZ